MQARTQNKDRAFEMFMTQSSDTESSKLMGSTKDNPRHEFVASEFQLSFCIQSGRQRWQTTVIRHRSEQAPGLYQRQFGHAFDTDDFSTLHYSTTRTSDQPFILLERLCKAPANATSLISSSANNFSLWTAPERKTKASSNYWVT